MSNQSGWVKRECDTCGHPVMSNQDHGMEYTMRGECQECPDCIERYEQEKARADVR